MSFSDDEIERYARHLVLAEIGGPGQQRLRAARVAIVGLGGVGAPAALYLAAAGVGTLRLIDDDAVGLSNLQRQIIFAEADVGDPKVEAGAARLGALNAHVEVETAPERLTPDNAAWLLDGCDLALDGTDDFETRFATNAACVAAGIPLVSGAPSPGSGWTSTNTSRRCIRACWVTPTSCCCRTSARRRWRRVRTWATGSSPTSSPSRTATARPTASSRRCCSQG